MLIKHVSRLVKQRIHDQILQDQIASIKNSSKLLFYHDYCLSSERAHYVDKLESLHDRSNLSKIRLSAHTLEIEKGRYVKINKEDRLCKICLNGSIEDENHFIWHCSKYKTEREIFKSKLSTFPSFNKIMQSNDIVLKKLLKSNCKSSLKLFSSFIFQITEIRKKSLVINE